MIPYKLKIFGIRDYTPRIIDFGSPEEHILITGPNGVGKSTLTFCLGAVLYSSKVEVEGLRSTNLKENEPWNARITLIFLNEGPTRIDGPKYIAFQLTINQEVKNGPIQREFEVLNGDEEDTLTLQARYTSGGAAGRNFSAYREDLQVRYKIEPDLYYLIWYQQEVNQFAAMYPEERFRKFSDMFKISETQKEWEASLEKIKEVEDDIRHFKSVQKSAEILLNAAKTELDRYLDNRKRIIESGSKYFTLLNMIIDKYSIAIDEVRETKEKNVIENEKLLVTQEKLKAQIADFRKKENDLKNETEQVKQELDNVGNLLILERKNRNEKIDEKNKLQKQLDQVLEKQKWLKYDEETTKLKLQEGEEELEKLEKRLEENKRLRDETRRKERNVDTKKASLEYKFEQIKQEIEEAEKVKEIYISSSYVKEQIQNIQQQLRGDFESISKLKENRRILQNQILQYEQRKIVSERQEKGLKHLKKSGIEAYTLRELIELMPNASISVEMHLEPIKYTIFYVGKNYKPINDLYYVSLNNLIPTESISIIPELGLQIRSDLNERQANFANKALWWVKQFFVEQPKIEHNILVDSRGVRGAQESLQYILSDVAIEKLLDKLKSDFNTLNNNLKNVEKRYKDNQNHHNQLQGHLNKIQHAESSLLKQSELETLKLQLDNIEWELSELYDEQATLENTFYNLTSQKSDLNYNLDELQKQWAIYEELGQFAEQQLKLQELENKIRILKTKIEQLETKQNELEDKYRNKSQELSRLTTEIQKQSSALNNVEGEITDYQIKITKMNEQLEVYDSYKNNYEIALQELENILPEESYKMEIEYPSSMSITLLRSEIEQAKALLNSARHEQVNENAVQNYEIQKKDFDQKSIELANAEELLESNTRRANELEDKLETTINMFLTKINSLFQKYMDMFQFEGLIEKERVIEKNGRIKFLLYIKARKHGHLGTLEDVSEKARSGKVGIGVSGGEESLSSLLFALSLLQNLSISPGYIVLDEFDSALDDERKNKVFNLYAEELKRKLIIISPKGHDEDYYNCFSKVYIVEHDASIPKSTIRGIQNKSV